MLLAEFSIWPMDKGQSVSEYVARCLDVIDRSGLPYRLGPMGTALEGEYDDVMAVLKQCFDGLLADCSRVTASVKLDYRKGYTGRLDAKVRRVEEHVGRKLRT
jgi:uncharacterized protein (TIGR00106 family)